MDLGYLDWRNLRLPSENDAISFWPGRGQRNERDYYPGGIRRGRLPIALSTMATQFSINSMLGIPAFVAFSACAGLAWLQG